MKIKRFFTRLAAVLAGLLLLAGCLCALAETFFRVPFTAWAGRALSAATPLGMLLTLVLVLLLGLVGVGCVMHALPGRKQRSSGFVMQKAENRPSTPSIRLSALIMPTTATIVSGVETHSGSIVKPHRPWKLSSDRPLPA